MAKYMPRIVGPWLCGIHDGDKAVMRAAQDALDNVFPSTAKKEGLSKIFHQNILEHCRDIILCESPKTLNDERNTTAEDAEFAYARVVSASLAEITALLNMVTADEVHKQKATYDELLGSKRLWTQISSQDSQVRRNLLRFLTLCLNKQKGKTLFSDQIQTCTNQTAELLTPHLNTISSHLLSKKAFRHQSGSSSDFCEALIRLTDLNAGIWLTSTDSKGSILERLGGWVKNGSQGGSPQFWSNFCRLIQAIPREQLDVEESQLQDFFQNIRLGLQRKDEPRTNLVTAWRSYLDLVRHLIPMVPAEDQSPLLSSIVSPLIRQYLRPSPESSAWSLPPTNAKEILVEALSTEMVAQNLVTEWISIGDELLNDMRNSVNTADISFEESQKVLALKGDKFFSLQVELLKISSSASTRAMAIDITQRIVSESNELLTEGQRGAFGIASCIDMALRKMGIDYFMGSEKLKTTINKFLVSKCPALVLSTSQSHIFSIMNQCRGTEEFENAWNSVLDVILGSEDSQSKLDNVIKYLCFVEAPTTRQDSPHNAELRDYLSRQVNRTLGSSIPSNWKFLGDFFGSSIARADGNSAVDVLSTLVDGLGVEDTTSNALRGLQTVSERQNDAIKPVLVSERGSSILESLLRIQEFADDEDAKLASKLSSKFESLLLATSSSDEGENPMLKALQTGMHEANEHSLAVDTLVGLGRNISKAENATAASILPDLQIWSAALEPHLEAPLPRPFVVTTELGGALYFINEPKDSLDPSAKGEIDATRTPKDIEGLSAPIRMAWYLTKLVTGSPSILNGVEQKVLAKIFELLCLTRQLADDELTSPHANGSWRSQDLEAEKEAVSFLSDTQKLIDKWTTDQAPADEQDSFIKSAQDTLFDEVTSINPRSIQHARVFAASRSRTLESKPPSAASISKLESDLKATAKSNSPLRLATLIVAYKPALRASEYLTRLMNELISDITGIDVQQESNIEQCLWKLIHLNLILYDDEEDRLEKVGSQRIIFFVMHVSSFIQLQETPDSPMVPSKPRDASLHAEIGKTLVKMLPKIENIYGNHWQSALELCCMYWQEPPELPYLVPVYHATLKLLQTLRRLAADPDANEDLKDGWAELIPRLDLHLTSMFVLFAGWNRDGQVFDIMSELVAQERKSLPLHRTVIKEMISCIKTRHRPIQRTAYEILHREVPKYQEEVSLTTALERSASEASHMQSLSVDLQPHVEKAPSPTWIQTGQLENDIPIPVLAYLSAWLLMFDCFKGSVSCLQR